MASTDSQLIFDAAAAAAALENEVRTTLKTRWPEACALAKWSHRAGLATTCDDSQLLVDASSSDVEFVPFGAPSTTSIAGSQARVAKRSLESVVASACLPHDVTIVHDSRRRRRWHVGVLVDATSNKKDEGLVTLGALEERHVPVLPLLMRRRSSFCRSVSAASARNQKVPQVARKGAASKLKRLRRIRESRLPSELVSTLTTSGGPGCKNETDVSCNHLRQMDAGGKRPAMDSRNDSFDPSPSLLEVLQPSAVAPLAAAPPFQQCQIQRSWTSRCTINLASIVGDAQLPGWSARLILHLGRGAHAAKPLACVSRDTAWSLLRDAVQLSAELRPIAHALAGASAWGDKEEIQFACVQNSGTMLSVFATLDIGSSIVGESSASNRVRDEGALASELRRRPRRQTQVRAMDALHDSEVRFEQVRVNRVGCLLSNLAQRARSLSHRFTAQLPLASRPSQVLL